MKISDEKYKGIIVFVFVQIIMVFGCSSSETNLNAIEDPYEKQDISGVWLGYMAANNSSSTFLLGIITKEGEDDYSARLIGQNEITSEFKQLISPNGSYLTQAENSAIFTGYLEDLTWSKSGPDYSTQFIFDQTNNTESLPLISLIGPASSKSVFGGPPYGAFSYGEKDETGVFVLYYNTTYDVAPNVNNIRGSWEINDVLQSNNTVILYIQPNIADTKGATISGHDDRGNTFNGTVTIYFNAIQDKPNNIYEVFLKMNNSINLSGLATYVLESNKAGIVVNKKTLAIGVSNSERSYFISGLAELIQ